MKKKTVQQKLDEQEEVIKKALIVGLTQRKIAEKLNVSQADICSWVNKRYKMKVKWIKPFVRKKTNCGKAISKKFNCPIVPFTNWLAIVK